MLTMENRTEVLPTLLQGKVSLLSGKMLTLLQGRVSLLSGQVSLLGDGKVSLLSDANTDALGAFLSMLQSNPGARVFTSKAEGSGAGTTGDVDFLVIPSSLFAAVNRALAAAGVAPLTTRAQLSPNESLVPDAGAAVMVGTSLSATSDALRPIINNAISAVGGAGMSTKAKVLLGLGAAAVIGGVALIAFSKSHTHHSLAGARRRRRR